MQFAPFTVRQTLLAAAAEEMEQFWLRLFTVARWPIADIDSFGSHDAIEALADIVRESVHLKISRSLFTTRPNGNPTCALPK
jgi:hypothetical protein